MRFLVFVSYDGSKFYGFQRLGKNPSVQADLEKALSKINKTKVMIKGAGRTDRGVHALNQAFHVDLNINIDEEGLKNALNSLVRPYINVNKVYKVNNNFHARYDVAEKTYEYIINMGEYLPLKEDYLYNYSRKLDIKKMKKASKYLIGVKNYEAFTSGERESYNSIIYSIKISKKKDELHIVFKGKSFYRYMVRNMVGALILAGEGKIKPEDMKTMIDKRKNVFNYVTVPANGLYLVNVKY